MSNYTHLNNIAVQGSIESSAQGKLIGSFDTMPAASSLNAGQIVLYTGATGTYTKGKFYVSNGTSWVLSDASPSSITIDSALSSTSINPVQNKVIQAALDGKLGKTETAARATADADGNTISTTYLKSATAANTYLTQSNAANTYLTKSDATNTYLTQNNAASTYLTQSNAGTTYLKKTDATSTYATKTELTSAVSSVYKFKGTKATYGELPTSGNTTGDVWNVTAAYGNVPAGTNWAWDGSAWDALAGTVDLSPYATKTELTNGLAGKQNTLTFDSTPTSGSSNPVTSGGVYSAINGLVPKSGATMTGQLVAQGNTAYTTGQVRNIYLSTKEPTDDVGVNGDIWFVYSV